MASFLFILHVHPCWLSSVSSSLQNRRHEILFPWDTSGVLVMRKRAGGLLAVKPLLRQEVDHCFSRFPWGPGKWLSWHQSGREAPSFPGGAAIVCERHHSPPGGKKDLGEAKARAI